MSVQLMIGECLDRMQEIPSGSVDMVMADLPYGTTACKWDAVIPFAPLWEQYRRVCKKNAAIVLTASQPFTSALVMSNLEMFKYCWVWEKSRPSGFAQAKNMPLKNYEDVAVFSTGVSTHAVQSDNRITYNPQNLVACGKTMRNTKERGSEESAFGKRPSHKDTYTQEFSGYPTQVIKFASQNVAVHPTQKPVALMEYLIRTYTNEGETVLDNTMGSGTTGVACINTGRKFIGIERDPEYFKIAQARCDPLADIW